MQHLAAVMDGNRRWATKQGLLPWHGHSEGVQTARMITKFCLEKKIPYLSLYTFSLENFNRSQQELSYLFDVVMQRAFDELKTLAEHGVRVCFIGDRDKFPESLRERIATLEQETAHGTNLQLNVLFCYGAQQEIVSGVKAVIKKIKQGLLNEDDLTPETFADCLWMQNIPAPDLILRSGGTRRLSNFLLYQAAYSELFFLDCMWPEVTTDHLENAISWFNGCRRNFGS